MVKALPIFLLVASFIVVGSAAPRMILHQPIVHQVFAGIDDTGIAPGEELNTNPKSRSVKVTASVRDTIAPTTPILVSPENNALLSQNIFAFTWQESTDAYGIAKYQLYLDGALKFDSISTSAQTTANYTLTVSSGVYSLTPTVAIADGAHTWKIVAFDANGNTADSATWNFTVDTTAPVLVITSIGGKIVSISAQDSSTIPSSPVLLTRNEPVVVGTTEKEITVKLTVFINSIVYGSVLETTSNSNGVFSFTLPTLPRNILVHLQVLAQDDAGNLSILDNIPIKITALVVTLPSPLEKLVPPVEITPPQELAKTLLKEAIRTIVPKSLQPSVEQGIDRVAPLANTMLGLLIPFLRILVAIQLLGIPLLLIPPSLFLRLLEALGLAPFFWGKRIGGIVYDQETHAGIPFAAVQLMAQYPIPNLQSPSENMGYRQVLFAQRVSDRDGLYPEMFLPQGKYTLIVSHRDYLFPPKPQLGQYPNPIFNVPLPDGVVYSGDTIDVPAGGAYLQAFIPMLLKPDLQRQAVLSGRRMTGVRYGIARLPDSLVVGATIVMLLPLLLSPTPWNIGMFVLYALVSLRRLVRRLRSPTLIGTVLEEDRTTPDAYALVRVRNMQSGQKNEKLRAVEAICAADLRGVFKAFVSPNRRYNLQALGAGDRLTKATEVAVERNGSAVVI